MSYRIPNNHCCRCFRENPSEIYTRKERNSTTKRSIKLSLPMCHDCSQHARIRDIVTPIMIVMALLLMIGLSYGTFELLPAVLENFWLMLVVLMMILVGIIVLTNWILEQILGEDYIYVDLMFAKPAIKFTNEQYHDLFQAANGLSSEKPSATKV